MKSGNGREKVCLVSEDRYLLCGLARELEGDFLPVPAPADGGIPEGLCVLDLDGYEGEIPDGAILLSREEETRAAFPDALPIPYPIGAVAQKLSEKKRDTPPLSLDKTSHAVRLFGKTVRLSELEFSLLSYLVSYRGEEAAREAILRDVFGGGTTPGMLNVYIHYLREKLGFAGRVILSSRGGGYRLSPELTGKNDLRKEEENGGC